MTEREAWDALQPPLIFANNAQIRARRFLERIAEAQELLEARNIDALHAFGDDVLDALAARVEKARINKEPLGKFYDLLMPECPECNGCGRRRLAA